MEIDQHIVRSVGVLSVNNLDGGNVRRLSVYDEAMSRDLPFWLAIGPICWHYTNIYTKGDYIGYKCIVLQ